MSSEQPYVGNSASDEQAKGGKAKSGKAKQVSDEKTILSPEEKAAKKAEADAIYYGKRAVLTAFINDAIDGKFLMTPVQYMLLLVQFALMRFTKESLQMDFGGKTLKQHIGNSYAHFLGSTIYAIQQKALDCFMEELPKLSVEVQISVIFQVLRYYTPLSPLSDELGGDCPSLDAKLFKYHMLYLCSMHGIIFKTVCDYAVAQKIVRIESLKTFFKVSGQNAFMLEGMTKLYSPSCTTVSDKVHGDIVNLTAKQVKLNAEKRVLDTKIADVIQKLADVSLAPKHEGLKKNHASLDAQLVTVVEAITTTSDKLVAMESLSTSVLAVEKKLVKQGGGTAETFFAGQNTEDWLSLYIASLAPCISHTDPLLLLPTSFTFESLFEMAKTQNKHANELLTVANTEAKKRMAEAGFQTETEEQRTIRVQMEAEAAFLSEEDKKKAEAAFESTVPNICEGVIVKVTLNVGGEILECNFKVKNEEKKF